MEGIKFIEWDSNFFNKKIGELEVETITIKDLKIIKESKYDLIYLRCSNGISLIDSNLDEKFINRKVFYYKDTSKYVFCDSNIKSIDRNHYKESRKLVHQIGSFSRFKTDPFLKNKYDELYDLWIFNSLERLIADEVYGYILNNQIIGLITLKKKCDSVYIGLIGVNEGLRGKQIGSKLLLMAQNWANGHNCKEIIVPTQENNVRACRFYEKNDFKILKMETIYHLWNS